MARINPPTHQPWTGTLINGMLSRRYGKPFPALELLGHNPSYPPDCGFFSSIFGPGKTKLPRQTKLLVTQLVAELNRCAFCADLGKRLAQDERHNLEKIAHVLEFETQPEWFTRAERAALRYALEATQVMARVTDETFAELKHHFSEREILELTVAIATENFYNRLNAPLEIESLRVNVGFAIRLEHVRPYRTCRLPEASEGQRRRWQSQVPERIPEHRPLPRQNRIEQQKTGRSRWQQEGIALLSCDGKDWEPVRKHQDQENSPDEIWRDHAKNRKNPSHVVRPEVAVACCQHAQWQAQQDHQQAIGQHQLERRWEELAEVGRDRTARVQTHAEIALRESAHELEVLQRQWAVQVQF